MGLTGKQYGQTKKSPFPTPTPQIKINFRVGNIAVCMAHNVDCDQMPHFAASDLVLHCL